MKTLDIVLYLIACACFVAAALGLPKVQWIAIGLLAWVLVPTIALLQS